MKVAFRLTVILCILAIVFTVMPGSMSGDAIVAYQKNATGYTVAEQLTSVRDVGTLTSNNSDIVKELDKVFGTTVEGLSPYLYDIVPVSDLYGDAIRQSNPIQDNSQFGKYRPQYGGYHSGTDFKSDVGSNEAAWHLAFFSGTVKYCKYHPSYGRCVLIESDAVPGLSILYAHMGPGNAYTSGGSQPGWQASMTYQNGEQITSYSQAPTEYEKSEGLIAKGKVSEVIWAGGSILVKEGDHVEAGQRIGLYGTTGNSSGTHSHIELNLNIAQGGHTLSPLGDVIEPPWYTYKASATPIFMEGKTLSQLEWKWYRGKKTAPGTALTQADVDAALSAVPDYSITDDEF